MPFEHPVSAGLFLVAVTLLAGLLLPLTRKGRDEVFTG